MEEVGERPRKLSKSQMMENLRAMERCLGYTVSGRESHSEVNRQDSVGRKY